jgi:hypothetical protein
MIMMKTTKGRKAERKNLNLAYHRHISTSC